MLIEEIASFTNLSQSLAHCRCGKKLSQGYQKFLLDLPDALHRMQGELLRGEYRWQPYRKFFVCDPKKRAILAAPFRDRIVHQAICQVIGETINAVIPKNSYACRQGMGNRHAAEEMLRILKVLGPQRTVVKLDVKQYFASIKHDLVLAMLRELLPDNSAEPLLRSLLSSHKEYREAGRGIPIGNVTSQYIANLFLAPLDRLGASESGIYYLRYMDDMVIAGAKKAEVYRLAKHIIAHAEGALSLEIPARKRVFLANDPVPFLGFVLDHEGYRPLRRNQRRLRRKVKRLTDKNVRPSAIAQVETSFHAWEQLNIR